jgi:transcriptional regulator with XRE-family HTH domain
VTHGDTPSTPPRPQDTPLQRFGATLRQYRKQRRLSQPALAARAGIRYSYISEIELGKRNISVLTLLRMTHVLHIPSAWLFAQVDTRAPLAPSTPCDLLTSREMWDAAATQDNRPPTRPDDQATLLPLLGATIRQARKDQRLSQPTLAARTGLNPTYLGQIEQGQRNLSVLSLVRIADALGLSVAHLLAPLERHQSPSSPRTP